MLLNLTADVFRKLQWIEPIHNSVSVSLLVPIEFLIDIFNIDGRGTKNANFQCGTGSEGQRT
jgi:hypothetical protein